MGHMGALLCSVAQNAPKRLHLPQPAPAPGGRGRAGAPLLAAPLSEPHLPVCGAPALSAARGCTASQRAAAAQRPRRPSAWARRGGAPAPVGAGAGEAGLPVAGQQMPRKECTARAQSTAPDPCPGRRQCGSQATCFTECHDSRNATKRLQGSPTFCSISANASTHSTRRRQPAASASACNRGQLEQVLSGAALETCSTRTQVPARCTRPARRRSGCRRWRGGAGGVAPV